MTTNEKEAFEERAGIMEFDGGLSKKDAERLALIEVQKRSGEDE